MPRRGHQQLREYLGGEVSSRDVTGVAPKAAQDAVLTVLGEVDRKTDQAYGPYDEPGVGWCHNVHHPQAVRARHGFVAKMLAKSNRNITGKARLKNTAIGSRRNSFVSVNVIL